jgi:predicted ferric reductase
MGGPTCIKKYFRWEVRKTAHYMCIPFGIALFWHTTRLFVFMGIIMGIYIVHKIYVLYYLSYKINAPLFRRLPNGVHLTFPNPVGYQKDQIGYINIMVPWVSTTQWHPFSVFGHPTRDDQSCICIIAAGDWTKQLHESVIHPTSRPVYIQGPFASPYEGAAEFDNLILVASGIGITPALSCMLHHKDGQRRVSLIWMCRDPTLIEFFLDVFDRAARVGIKGSLPDPFNRTINPLV